MKRNKKVSVITLGCSKNTVDSERLMRQIQLNDIPLTDDPNKAETVIINTCGFIEAAKEESVNTILQAVALKNSGRLKKLIVAGCLSERYMDDLKNEIPEVDVYFGTEKYEEIIKELGGKFKYELLGERLLSTPSHTAYLKISEGCDHPCSFCAIPLMRGKHKSKTLESLIEETEFLAANGTKELILIAQDTTDYGKDIYGRKNLSELLNKLSEVKGIEWIRLMYAYPSHFPDDVIETIADNPKVLKYVDIPLQHISDDVLKSMRRGVTSKQTYNLLYKLRKRIPDITLRTTFIVGYPNESEKDFEQLVDFIKEIKFDRVGTFTFSVEENTSSFILGDPVSKAVKEKRKEILMEIQSKISLEKNQTFVGKTLKVLLESKESEYYVGRSYRDAPEVDGEILFKSEKKLKPGNFYDVRITDYDEYDLYGEVLLKEEK
ncbi:MAG: 30S ribosomal protein S12 methylthiotransferase RimO [Ignavibacterium album]|uniref:30S ribosomal protein S12 methylthiotransferase RimO n=1 Tax=Ignavibacterium album TaxID=591197 RepID=UPI0026F0F6E5|nr:30S ribosomal protein S12 methylthiotransferase RimO [Ignavibacterium album]MCX8104758.1 30S ribosomal protein S12 methylthiotransferase RimO [Ignavibacterium album]